MFFHNKGRFTAEEFSLQFPDKTLVMFDADRDKDNRLVFEHEDFMIEVRVYESGLSFTAQEFLKAIVWKHRKESFTSDFVSFSSNGIDACYIDHKTALSHKRDYIFAKNNHFLRVQICVDSERIGFYDAVDGKIITDFINQICLESELPPKKTGTPKFINRVF